MDPYEILGIPSDASRAQIDDAYREKSRKHHPESGGDEWAHKQVEAAYVQLSKMNPSEDGAPPPKEQATDLNVSADSFWNDTLHKAKQGLSDFWEGWTGPKKMNGSRSAETLQPTAPTTSDMKTVGIVWAIIGVVTLLVSVLLIWWLGFGGFIKLAIGWGILAAILSVLEKNKIKVSPVVTMIAAGTVFFLATGKKLSGPPSILVDTLGTKQPVQRLSLGADASVKEISDAYEPFFYFVTARYRRHTKVFLGENHDADGCVGSGVLIANDHDYALILTNRHVVDPNFAADVMGEEGVRFDGVTVSVHGRQSPALAASPHKSARIVGTHNSLDLALLLIDGPFDQSRAVSLAKGATIVLGDPVVALGNPGDLGYRAREGRISSEPADHVEHTCQIDPGFSGGPLILRQRGSLVGINTFMVGRGGNYAVTLDGVMDSLRNPRATHQDWQLIQHRLKPGAPSMQEVIQKLVSTTEVVDAH